MNLDCINDLIGYVPKSCPCLPSAPGGIKATTSELGKFLSDLLPTDFVKNCGDSTIWDTMERTKESTKIDVTMMLISQLQKSGKIYSPWTGNVGLADVVTTENATGYNGLRIAVNSIRRGVYATIRTIDIFNGSTGTKNIKVVDKNGIEIYSGTVSVDSGEDGKWKTKTLSAAISLPLWSDDEGELVYYLLWDANKPALNEAGCGCSGQPEWANAFTVTGVKFAALPGSTAEVNAQRSHSKYMSGLRPKVTIECDFNALICMAQGDARIAVGIVFWYKWAINTIEYIINSGQITTWTALGGEYLEGLLQNHSVRLAENLKYLAEILYTGDCVSCAPSIRRVSHRI